MTAKFAVLSDVHLDRPFRWAGSEVGHRLRTSLRKAFSNAVELACNSNVDAFLLPGDIYEHEHYGPDTSNFLRDQLKLLHPIPVVVAAGNHDHLAPQSIWAQTGWSPNVTVAEIDRWTPVQLEDGLTLWGRSHGRARGTANLLTSLSVGGSGVDIAVFHGALRLAGLNDDPNGAHAPFDAQDIEDAGIAHAFVGHYHNPCHTELLTYPGNPAPLDFGELGNRGLVVAEVDDSGSVTITTEQVFDHQMHDLDLDVTGASSGHDVIEKLRSSLDGLDGVVRVTLTGEMANDLDLREKDLQISTAKVLATVVRRGELTVAYDFDRIASEDTVRGQFVSDVLNENGLDDDMRRSVLIAGLRALDGRDDLEVI